MIKRHLIRWDKDYFEECVILQNNRLNIYLNNIIKNNSKLNLASASSYLNSSSWYNILANQPKTETYKFLRYALDFGIAHFQKAMADGQMIEIILNNERFEIEGKFTKHHISLGDWNTTLSIAFILNDQHAINYLLSIPKSFMMQNEQSHSDYVETSYDFRIELLNQKGEKIKNKFSILAEVQFRPASIVAGRGLDQERTIDHVNEDRLYFVQNILFPIDELLYSVNFAPEKFNSRLEVSLLTWKEFIKKDNLEDDWSTWISRRHLAACAYAHQQGIKITVESDYIPKWLYEGNWEEEV